MSPANTPTMCVLLAAGAGKRFLGPVHKLLTSIETERGSEPVVLAAARAMVTGTVAGPVVVVEGAVPLADALAPLRDDGLVIAHNAGWSTGMRSSLLLAVSLARGAGCSRLVVGLGDQPFVEPSTWADLAMSVSPVAVATYGGRRGNPVALGPITWDAIETEMDDPDTGARNLVSRHPEWVAEIPARGSDRDIDTLEDLTSWKH